MEKSTVYFTDFRCPVGTSQLDKLRKLCVAAGIKDIDMDGKFVAIKMHFGELGNMAFLRPNYAKVVADLCKEQGGMPFLTDCNTLYPGSILVWVVEAVQERCSSMQVVSRQSMQKSVVDVIAVPKNVEVTQLHM